MASELILRVLKELPFNLTLSKTLPLKLRTWALVFFFPHCILNRSSMQNKNPKQLHIQNTSRRRMDLPMEEISHFGETSNNSASWPSKTCSLSPRKCWTVSSVTFCHFSWLSCVYMIFPVPKRKQHRSETLCREVTSALKGRHTCSKLQRHIDLLKVTRFTEQIQKEMAMARLSLWRRNKKVTCS